MISPPILDVDFSLALVPTDKCNVGSPNTLVPAPRPNAPVSSKEKLKQPCHISSTPPILWTTDGMAPGPSSGPSLASHALAVAQVSGALNLSPLLENSDLSMSESGKEETDDEDSDCAMSEYDDPDEPDDFNDFGSVSKWCP